MCYPDRATLRNGCISRSISSKRRTAPDFSVVWNSSGIHPKMTNLRWILRWIFERECNLSNLDLHNFWEFQRIVDVPNCCGETCIRATKIRCSLVKGGHQKEGKHDLFDASGVTPPNNLLLENAECKVPYHLKTPVLWIKPSIYHYLTWWNTTSHIFFTQQLLVVLRVFFKKTPQKYQISALMSYIL